MAFLTKRHPKRRGGTSNTASLIGAWSMEGAEVNTTDLIGAWSMEGSLRALPEELGSRADAPAIATAERAHLCGTAYEVPILVKDPDDESWRPLGATEATADASAVAERLLGY
jgi:hypothetical protein